MPNRDYDIVLYGATGFTGRQTVAWFARHAPPGLRWAIAARSRAKLEAVRAAVGAPSRADDVLVADSGDPASVIAVVARTRVLLSTAGPFALHGTPVVDACVRFGTHYADISGETMWQREMIARHHERAAAQGTRIVPGCGFDSVPSDLGAMLVVRRVQEMFGVACEEVRAYFRLAGGLNGGTVATGLLAAERGGRAAGADDPFALDAADGHTPAQRERSADVRAPRFDAEIGAWVGPFVMGPINTRVVRRSASLHARWGAPYGRDGEFVYQEYQRFDPPLGRAKAVAAAAAVALAGQATQWAPFRRVLATLLPHPGSGPSERTMERGWFTCDLVGIGTDRRRVRGLIAYRGDPANRATVTMLCESALALAQDGEALPGGPTRGGVLTPATALGDVLAARLRRAGMRLELDAQ
jgi:short subunit dehydrogenase-like uncharacterized protein